LNHQINYASPSLLLFSDVKSRREDKVVSKSFLTKGETGLWYMLMINEVINSLSTQSFNLFSYSAIF